MPAQRQSTGEDGCQVTRRLHLWWEHHWQEENVRPEDHVAAVVHNWGGWSGWGRLAGEGAVPFPVPSKTPTLLAGSLE